MRDQDSLTEAVNVSGRQRMLSQKIAFQAVQLLEVNDTVIYAQKIQDLSATITLMEESHYLLTGSKVDVDAKYPIPENIRPIYFGPIGRLDAEVKKYIDQAYAITNLDILDINSRHKMVGLLGILAEDMLPNLDLVVREYRAESANKVLQLEIPNAAALIVMLLVLMGSAFYILRPSLKIVDKALEDRDATKKRLGISEKSLVNAQRIAKIGNWEMSILGSDLIWSDEVYRIIEIEPGSKPASHEMYLSVVHPEDVRKVLLASQRAVNLVTQNEVQYRLICPSGKIKYIRERSETLFDKDGNPHHVSGTVQDISELIMVQNQMEESKRLLGDAIEAIDDAFAIYDAEDNIIMANKRYSEFYPKIAHKIQPGVSFETLVNELVATNQVQIDGNNKEWLEKRLHHHKENSKSNCEILLSDDRWLRVSESATQDGGIVQIETDITKSKHLEQSLRESKEISDKANQAKSVFLSNMSHELRTPLNAILGFAQMLAYNPKSPLNAKQVEYVGFISTGGEHLLSLINDVLDLAKIEAGHAELSLDVFPLKQAMDECITLIEPMAKKSNISIKKEFGDDDPFNIQGDYTRVKQVLMNLLSNAIKYNRENGSVTLTINPTDHKTIQISVIDTGLGIPADRMDELFKPFNRLEAENSEIEGTGIGLTITKNLIELMGGSISCKSVINVGTTFSIEIPIIDFEDALEPSDKNDGPADSSVLSLGISDGKTINMLYIEDNRNNLCLMEEIVSNIPKLNMYSANSGELGLKVARSRKPDIIVLDINLPGIDGIETFKQLQEAKETQHIPVIALSAQAMDSDVEKGRAANFFEYLTKPIEIKLFIKTLKNALEKGNHI